MPLTLISPSAVVISEAEMKRAIVINKKKINTLKENKVLQFHIPLKFILPSVEVISGAGSTEIILLSIRKD